MTSDESELWRSRGRALDVCLDVPAGGLRIVRLDLAVTGHPHVPAADALRWRSVREAQERTLGPLVRASHL
ncbi:hypothetical protein, partial [Streptomyces galilaeus]|uniref:hypothetical protein n=1 Tax=Streptomyces galilaeus TaxID=33899 RepID=UPI0038F73A81